MIRKTRAVVALTVAAVAASAFIATPGEASPDPDLPVFQVGAAFKDINPLDDPDNRPEGQWLGGFDNKFEVDGPVNQVHDPLQARAFTVSKDGTALAFAVVDIQGWFSGYQEGPYGITDAREQVATWLREQHIDDDATSAQVIISSTHSHAAPTIMGIWGEVDANYLKMVHDNTVTAIKEAFLSAEPANLFTANGDVGAVDGSNTNQTDMYDGWTIDGNMPILDARDPESGKTIALYANVPIHADVVNGYDITNPDGTKGAVSADHIGLARVDLENDLKDQGDDANNSDDDPIVVLAMGTLGRQESLIQVDGIQAAQWVADHVRNEIEYQLETNAVPVTSSELGAGEQHIIVPGSNPLLLALVMGNAAGPQCTDNPAQSICTIDRSFEPPYQYGGALGTWVNVFRIGDIAYVTEPGEAFPEVSEAIRDGIDAPGGVRVIGMAQDQLGYYFPPEDAPFAEGLVAQIPTNGDHMLYNSSLVLADMTVDASVLAARAVGFDALPAHPMTGMRDPIAWNKPGVQFFPVIRYSKDKTVRFLAAANEARDGSPLVNGIAWDFGDDTNEQGPNNTRIPMLHTYQNHGCYTVTASVTDESGRTRSWTQPVYVGTDPANCPS
ncbi:MAG: hypothetical protein QOG04_1897 [Actinomycetota bacterium]|jgi:hypothetical protein|nr:hypothetical protein [Actinomycetota bacterium]